MTIDKIDTLLSQIESLADHYEKATAQGEIIDFSPLEVKLKHFYSLLENLPDTQARTYLDALATTRAKIASCSALLNAEMDNVRKSLQALNQSSQAQQAYRKTAAFPKDESKQ